jgi:xanthine dehydrogenase accessory factor
VVTEVLSAVAELVSGGGRGALTTAIEGPLTGVSALVDEFGTPLAGEPPGDAVTSVAARVIETATPTIVTDGEDVWFVEPVRPRPRLIVLGAISVADALVPMARAAGYEVTVIDPRPWLARSERYPEAADVVCGDVAEAFADTAVDAGTVIVSFLHEARLEDEVLIRALAGPARYVGSMGSGKSTEAKRGRLIEAGLAVEQVERLRAPIGLDIGSRSPSEIAVSILAEIVATGRGRG